ncbi:formate/nitrite transporter family protein [Helcococcus kunzii]|uniref:formate/nitrite transporter family protein n=1 Tax=Helcococcus kunzii TaxID=40091 RepID=UPI0038A97F24
MESSFVNIIEKNCQKKENLISKSIGRYAYRSMLAGAALTLTTFAGTYSGDQVDKVIPGLGKFLYALLFAFGLVYILFMHMELATSNMMYLSAGAFLEKIYFKKVIYILFICTLFNLVGSIVTGWLINQTGLLKSIMGDGLLIHMVEGKLAQDSLEIFFSGIVANIFVNIAIISYLLLKEESSKVTIALSAVFMFVYLGLNHVIANFGSFLIAYFTNIGSQVEGLDILNVLRQWLFAFIGNFVGGGLILGLGYAWLNKTDSIYKD